MSSVPIYTPGWRETKWSKVPCLRKQRDRWGLNPRPPDPEFEVFTARPHTPTRFNLCNMLIFGQFFSLRHVARTLGMSWAQIAKKALITVRKCSWIVWMCLCTADCKGRSVFQDCFEPMLHVWTWICRREHFRNIHDDRLSYRKLPL